MALTLKHGRPLAGARGALASPLDFNLELQAYNLQYSVFFLGVLDHVITDWGC